jgi:hypothetical protein
MTSSKMRPVATFATDQDRDRAAFAIATGNIPALAGIKVVVEMTSEAAAPASTSTSEPRSALHFYTFNNDRMALRHVGDWTDLHVGERWLFPKTRCAPGKPLFGVCERIKGRSFRGVTLGDEDYFDLDTARRLVMEGVKP